MKAFSRHLLIALCLLAVISCKKSKHNPSNAGTTIQGGDVTVIARVMHHNWSIAKCKVYIKANTTVFPGRDSTLYDSFKVSDDYGYVMFDKLPNGNYYLYASGFDVNVALPVWGYLPFNVSVVKGESKEIDLNVPVSE